MRIALTGAGGQLGTELRAAFGGHDLLAYGSEELDVTAFEQTVKVLEHDRPDLVVNAAAYTDVDGAELNPDLAYKVNAIGPRNLAIASNRVGAALLHIGTDFVFDGEKDAPYIESDPTNPLSVYGLSKLAGEKEIMTLTNRFYICRTAWLYGHGGHNFVKTMLRLGEEGRTVKVVDDQFGCPTSAADLAAKLAEIGTSGRYGLYHTCNGGRASWFDLAAAVFEFAGMEVDLRPVKSDEMKRPATRPASSVLRSMSLELSGMATMRDWQAALADYFNE